MGVNSLARDTLSNTVKYTNALAGNSIYDVSSMVPIATYTLPSTASNIIFSNVPQNYQDLMLVASVQKTSSTADPFVSLNNDYTSNSASRTLLYGNGSSAISDRRSNDSTNYIWPITGSSTIFSSVIVHILNYTSSVQKTLLWRVAQDLNGSGVSVIGVGRKNIGAVTYVEFNANGSFSAGSTMTLYGIKAVGQ